MCGVAGLVDFNGLSRDTAEGSVRRALARLAPRGPDGDGLWADGQAIFGHRRLAVIDLSDHAAQPMARHGAVITFNGEIYNFAALRSELEQAGRRFHSRSDTEVLLAGWMEWGEALLPKLNGMFAFALWDPARRELVLARDRFGKKPLLLWRDGVRVAFASDFIALEAAAGRRFPLSPEALRWLFTLRFIPDPWCIGEGVEKLRPGHLLRVTAGGAEMKRWASPLSSAGLTPLSEGEAAERLRVAMNDAVAARLVSDVPLGAFLSGGVYSAIVAASMAARTGALRTFTVGFSGAPDYYEERPAARELARFIGAAHTEIDVDLAEAPRVLDQVFAGLDEPFADSSAVPTYLVARETRRHVTVALSGDGADELLGGYRKYQGELYAGFYGALPQFLRRGVIEKLLDRLPEGKETGLRDAVRRARRFVAHAAGAPGARQAGWARLLSPAELDELLLEPSPGADLEGLVATLRADARSGDPINTMLGAEMALGLPGDMLVKVDRMSMANGLEVRCPFLDPRVVDAAMAAPGRCKLQPGRGKAILRRAFAGLVPDRVFTRPKKGFELPVDQWLRGELADLVRAVTDPARLRRQGLFAPEAPARWQAELTRGRDTSWKLWTMIAFQKWASLHGRPEAVL